MLHNTEQKVKESLATQSVMDHSELGSGWVSFKPLDLLRTLRSDPSHCFMALDTVVCGPEGNNW